VYILGRKVISIVRSNPSTPEERRKNYTLRLSDFPDPLTCSVLVSSSSSSSSSSYPVLENENEESAQHIPLPADTAGARVAVARCIAVVDRVPTFMLDEQQKDGEAVDSEGTEQNPEDKTPQPLDTAVLVFPPPPTGGEAATVLVMGSGTMSCPSNRWIVYISLPLPTSDDTNPEKLLKPYLEATIAPSSEALWTTFYIQHPPSPPPPSHLPSPSTLPKTFIAPEPLPTPGALPLPETPDLAATHAENVFWEVVRALRGGGGGEGEEIESFWPVLDGDIAASEEGEEDF